MYISQRIKDGLLCVKKVLDKSKLFGNNQLHQARNECAIQQYVKDPAFVELYEYTENESEIIMYMQYVKTANYLEDKIWNRKREFKNEAKLKKIVKDILQALKTLHEKNIVHADIKVPNILVVKPTKEEKNHGM